jgi:hypothetical protein
MRQRRIPEFVVSRAWPDREIRWRGYDAQRVEIVVDLTDGTIVSAWITRVNQ